MNTKPLILAAGICAAMAMAAMAASPLDLQTRQERFGVGEAAQRQGDQAQIDLEVVKKMNEAVVALGAAAANAAIAAESAAEADHVLASFCRAMERCAEIGMRPLDPNGGSIEPVLRAIDIAEIADRQRIIWNATPEQKERWDGGVSDAPGRFHGVIFRLREGSATIKAPCGLANEKNRDYTKNPDGTKAHWRHWRLETLPHWTFGFADKDCFLLVAQGLDDNGHSRYGDAAGEDALLLMWRDQGDASGSPEWNCAYLASRLYPLETEDAVALEECGDPGFDGTLLKVETFRRPEAAGDSPVVFGLEIDKDDGDLLASLREQTASEDEEDSVIIPLAEAEAAIKSIVETVATGGRPLPQSDESLSYRYDCARRSFVEKKLGFDKPREWPSYPDLAPVGNFSGIQLDLAAKFAEAVSGNVAQFPDGEIRWTEDGTNGLSLIESDEKLREAQIKCIREEMEGREVANDPGTLWLLDDDFIFGYAIGLVENHDDDISYLLGTRRDIGRVPAGSFFVLKHIPSQTVLDSIVGAFKGDEPSVENLSLLNEANMVDFVAGDETP